MESKAEELIKIIQSEEKEVWRLTKEYYDLTKELDELRKLNKKYDSWKADEILWELNNFII
jgi:hypothetical protein